MINASNIFHGEVINLRDVITFEGETVGELKQAFQDSVDDYLDFCADRGENPEKPYSGKFVVCVEPELHKNISIEARKKGKSLNVWVKDALSKALKDPTQHQASQDRKNRADFCIAQSSFNFVSAKAQYLLRPMSQSVRCEHIGG